MAILAHVPAAFLPLKPPLNSNRPNRKSRTKNTEKPPFQAVFLPKVVGVRGLEPRASCSQSRRATNCATPRNEIVELPGRFLPSRRATSCATPGYEVVGWPGRILPKQARYQLCYTRICYCLASSSKNYYNISVRGLQVYK